MTKKIEKNAIDRTMEDIFYDDNLLIRIIAAQEPLAERRGDQYAKNKD